MGSRIQSVGPDDGPTPATERTQTSGQPTNDTTAPNSTASWSGSRTSSVTSSQRRPRTLRDPTADKLKYYAEDKEMQAVLNTAKHHYRCFLLTKDVFPSVTDQQVEADKAYMLAGGTQTTTSRESVSALSVHLSRADLFPLQPRNPRSSW